jgi:hypothetical protein
MIHPIPFYSSSLSHKPRFPFLFIFCGCMCVCIQLNKLGITETSMGAEKSGALELKPQKSYLLQPVTLA